MNFKKLFSLSLACVMLMSFCVFPVFAANGIIMEDDFDNLIIGAYTGKATNPLDGCKGEIKENTQDKSDKYLYVEDMNDKGMFGYATTFEAQTQPFTIAFDYKMEDGSKGGAAFYVSDSKVGGMAAQSIFLNPTVGGFNGVTNGACGSKIAPNTWVSVTSMINPKEKTFTLYINGVAVAQNYRFRNENAQAIDTVIISGDTGTVPTKFSINNIAITKGAVMPAEASNSLAPAIVEGSELTMPSTDKAEAELKTKIGGALALLVNYPVARQSGEYRLIDKDSPRVSPFVLSNRTLVPVRFIAEAFGMQVAFDEETEMITLKSGAVSVEMGLGSVTMKVNGIEKQLDVAANTYNDRTFIPLRAMAESLGKQVFWDERGLIIIGDSVYMAKTDESLIQYVIAKLKNETAMQAGGMYAGGYMEKLGQAPIVYDTELAAKAGVRSVFYQGAPYQGKETRVYAYIGLPDNIKPGQKVPGMVLAHGGGGTAYAEWVRLWNAKGYAAIAMDLEGHTPDKKTHAWSGPQNSIFGDIHAPVEDQWMYHASSDIMLAHSLLASMDAVDSNKIGLTGISWGGVLASFVMGVDNRFMFAIPVYGCGFLNEAENDYYKKLFSPWNSDTQKRFSALWAAQRAFPQVTMPVLFVNSDHDTYFPITITNKSKKGVAGFAQMSIQPTLTHSHSAGWNPPEIYAFADSFAMGGTPLAKIISQEQNGDEISLVYSDSQAARIVSAQVVYSKLPVVEAWKIANTNNDSSWSILSASVNQASCTVTATIPTDTKTYYVIIKDSRGLMVSSELVFR